MKSRKLIREYDDEHFPSDGYEGNQDEDDYSDDYYFTWALNSS